MKRDNKQVNERYVWIDDDELDVNGFDKYDLVGVDGNAFSVMAYVARAMKEMGYPSDAIDCYKEEARSGDYNHLLCLSATMVDNCNKLYKEGKKYSDVYESKRYMYDVPLNEDFSADDIQINMSEELSSVRYPQPIERNEECLYMTPEDFDSEGIDFDAFVNMIENNPLPYSVGYKIDGGSIQYIFNRKFDQYKFGKILRKNGLILSDLKPYIYNQSDMDLIVKKYRSNYLRETVNEGYNWNYDPDSQEKCKELTNEFIDKVNELLESMDFNALYRIDKVAMLAWCTDGKLRKKERGLNFGGWILFKDMPEISDEQKNKLNLEIRNIFLKAYPGASDYLGIYRHYNMYIDHSWTQSASRNTGEYQMSFVGDWKRSIFKIYTKTDINKAIRVLTKIFKAIKETFEI